MSKSYAKIWTLSNSNLEVQFDDKSALLSVKDNRCGKIWKQAPINEPYTVVKVQQKDSSLYIQLKAKMLLDVKYTLSSKSSLQVSVSSNNKLEMDDLAYPSAFVTPDKNHYLLQTDGEGLLLPVTDTEYPLGNGTSFYCGGGLSMAWMGITDTDFKTGYMAILETPYDAAIETRREGGLITYRPVWKSTMGKFGYERKLKYVFFDEGGYVAQCKEYRNYIWKKNNVLSLAERQKKTPSIAKMVGAVHIYVWDTGRNAEFANEMKVSGIDKALVLWNPNHTPYPENGYSEKIKNLGYAIGMYDCFTDAHKRDTALSEKTFRSETPFWCNYYPGLYNYNVARKKDGSVYTNSFGDYNCPVAIQPQVTKRLDPLHAVYNNDSYFLDVSQANGLYECYSKLHPATRQQYAENMVKYINLVVDRYNVFMGAEWGADFAGSSSVYAHGMMTLQRTWFNSDIQKKGTIYYYGNWRNNPRPTQMLSSRVAPDTYLKFSINEYTRVPLFELVYHDAIVTSWRWEDCNHHTPEIWWKKDLFNLLYGNAPLWSIDRSCWENYKQTFIESYRNICPWLQQIGYDEMVSHRFITPDHKVQESVFSSGKSIIVNFGNEDYDFKGKIIRRKSYIYLGN
ncbi:MAG: hypothetical protein AUK44_06860 [Porphyromonadaceae bacterium CG2_30_38_12]|nr:MAG: hypothetical protein AUK44_06860 [Porphyromonadaceae bacterium CG2_30_38_12]